MKLKTVTFDATCAGWTPNRDSNLMFIKNTEHSMNSLISRGGYIYLDMICMSLGVKRDPYDEFVCLRDVNDGKITYVEFETFVQADNTILVNILTI